MVFNTYETVAIACLVLLLGYFLVKRIKLLDQFSIPEPVVGGVIAAIIITVIHQVWHIELKFDVSLQQSMMLVFFSSVGLSANFSSLVKGGKPLLMFLLASSLLIVLQNVVGMISAMALGINPSYGLIAGSITLTGGHGNGAAWADTLSERFGISGAMELAMACATFGLVAGGIVGGPVARYLLKKMHRPVTREDQNINDIEEPFEKPAYRRSINARSLIEGVAMLALCLIIGTLLDKATKGTMLQLPTFVWCLFVGTLIRNFLSYALKLHVSDESNDVLGSISLLIFLAIALMSLKLWELAHLAIPVLIILLIQVVVMVLYAVYVTYRMMGCNYDAVVLTAGHCGFGLGATPTAIANMQSITSHFGPSHKSFLILPMVGGFFNNLVNTACTAVFIKIAAYLI